MITLTGWIFKRPGLQGCGAGGPTLQPTGCRVSFTTGVQGEVERERRGSRGEGPEEGREVGEGGEGEKGEKMDKNEKGVEAGEKRDKDGQGYSKL